jgi:hypothetical protein
MRSSPLDPAHLAPPARYYVPATEARNWRENTPLVWTAVRLVTEKVMSATNLTQGIVVAARNYAENLMRIQEHEFGKLYNEQCRGCLDLQDLPRMRAQEGRRGFGL